MVTNSFAYLSNTFPPTGLPRPVFTSCYIPGLMVAYHAMFVWVTSLGGLLFCEGREREGGMNLGDRGSGRETAVRM